MTEVFDGERDDWRRSVVRVGSPRQTDTRLGHVQHVRPRWSSGKRGRLGRPMKHDAWIGRRLDDQVCVPRRLTRLTGRLTRV